jgi:hypothetical protein
MNEMVSPAVAGEGVRVEASDFAIDGEGDRNVVFQNLVTGDSDIVGLVAYSIYKQNKHDWLVAYWKARARSPQEGELAAYIIGESTPRRLATYRHLAEATLEGRGPDVPAGGLGEAGGRTYAIAQRQRGFAPGRGETAQWTVPAFIGLVIVAVVGIWLAARYGLPGITAR